MSLRFALWMTEQGIMTCDQFCGLVKIQQDSLPSPGAIALQRNLMSIRQVAEVNNLTGTDGDRDFLEVAVEKNFIQPAVAELISRLQELSGESLTALAIRCGLITSDQARVLFRHYLKAEARRNRTVDRTPAAVSPELEPVAAEPIPANTGGTDNRQPIPEPKFRQRPVIVHQYDVTW